MISVTRAGVGTTVETAELADGSVTAAKLADDYDRDNGQAGLYAPALTVGVGASGALTANRAYFSRFVPSRNMTIASMSFVVTTAASSDDACDVGLYSSSGTKIVSAGATTGKLNATGVKNVDIADTALTAGTVYYAAFSLGAIGGTSAQILVSNLTSVHASWLFGSTLGVAEGGFMNAAHTLPASLVLDTGGITYSPFLALRT